MIALISNFFFCKIGVACRPVNPWPENMGKEEKAWCVRATVNMW